MTYGLPESVGWRSTSEGTVVVDVATGTYRVLEGIQAEIWDGFTRGQTLLQISSELMDRYEVEPPVLTRDLAEFAESLAQAGFLVPALEPPDKVDSTVDAILFEKIRGGHLYVSRACSNSMKYLIHEGNPVALRWTPPERLRPGDIIALHTSTHYRIHRYKGQTNGGIRTRGDFKWAYDPIASWADYRGQIIWVRKGKFKIPTAGRWGRGLGYLVEAISRLALAIFRGFARRHRPTIDGV